MWPAAQTPRTIRSGRVSPASSAGIQSQCSTKLCAAAKTFGAARLQRSALLQNHSEEYVPPHLARYCGRIFRARSVISAASAWPVWSFQSQAIASRFPLNCGSIASGVPSRSTGIGVLPVVSTPMPTIRAGIEARSAFFARRIVRGTTLSAAT